MSGVRIIQATIRRNNTCSVWNRTFELRIMYHNGTILSTHAVRYACRDCTTDRLAVRTKAIQMYGVRIFNKR